LAEDPGGQGYKLYSWDIFDVAERCRKACKRCVPEFAEKYCRGKAKRHRAGWVPIANIVEQWTGRLSDEDFEVELMGWRPSSEGLVLDPVLVDAALSGAPRYLPGQPTAILIDWGLKGWACVLVAQEQEDRAIAVVDAEYFHMMPDTAIYAHCEELSEAYGTREIYADASHPYQNYNLALKGFQATEVRFAEVKDLGAGWIKGLTERGLLRLPGEAEGNLRQREKKEYPQIGADYADKKQQKYRFPGPDFKRLHGELKGWRRGKNGQIVKKDDHGPDALLCGAMKWAGKAPWSAEFASSGRRVSAEADY
jgi:hypothetical protein